MLEEGDYAVKCVEKALWTGPPVRSFFGLHDEEKRLGNGLLFYGL